MTDFNTTNLDIEALLGAPIKQEPKADIEAQIAQAQAELAALKGEAAPAPVIEAPAPVVETPAAAPAKTANAGLGAACVVLLTGMIGIAGALTAAANLQPPTCTYNDVATECTVTTRIGQRGLEVYDISAENKANRSVELFSNGQAYVHTAHGRIDATYTESNGFVQVDQEYGTDFTFRF